MNLQFQICSDL